MNIKQLPKRMRTKIRVNEATGCWEWANSKNEQNYGKVWYNKKSRRAHIVIYELLIEPIPKDLECDHLCRVRHCVNPEHIELVPHKENMLRGHSSEMQTHLTGVCKRGHKIEGDNAQLVHSTYNKERNLVRYRCRKCSYDSSRLCKQRNREQLKHDEQLTLL